VKDQTKLGLLLLEKIRNEGPVTFHNWMAEALYHPRYGYYMTDRERWGRKGDYGTSPQRSPLFAAVFARVFARLFESLGSPDRISLIEVGGGDATFAVQCIDVIRKNFPELFAAAEYLFIEQGTGSLQAARSRLAKFGTKVDFISTIDPVTLSANPCIIFSNELLDAFPVHRVVRRGTTIRELYVSGTDSGEFQLEEGDLSTPLIKEYFLTNDIELRDGQIAEVNLEARAWLEGIARSIQRGYLVTVDYGEMASELYDPERRAMGSLRAFSRHKIEDELLQFPGEQDLTSSLCWSDLIATGERQGLETIKLQRLDQFLLQNGILEELEAAMLGDAGPATSQLALGAREMILPSGMAGSFQVLVQRKVVSGQWSVVSEKEKW
jgi:SAM-dependent MidA family methyltransferase